MSEEPVSANPAEAASEVKEAQPATQPAIVNVAEPSAAPPADTGVSFGMAAVIAFVFSLITNACMLMAYDHYMAQKVLSVDVKGFIEQQQELFLAGKISGDQLKGSYKRLLETVESIPRNRVVVMGDAVLGGAEKLEITTTPKK